MYYWGQTCSVRDYNCNKRHKMTISFVKRETFWLKKTREALFFETTLLVLAFFLSCDLQSCLMWRWVRDNSLVQQSAATCHFFPNWMWTSLYVYVFFIKCLHTIYIKYFTTMWPCVDFSWTMETTLTEAGSSHTIYCMRLLTHIDIRMHFPWLRS